MATLADWLASLTADQKEFFEERAGILEHDAKFPRQEAERRAMQMTCAYYRLPMPR